MAIEGREYVVPKDSGILLVSIPDFEQETLF